MAQAKKGDTVRVHYTGRLSDGTVFDSSRDSEPLEFTLGDEEVIPGFENAVIGMSVGESKTERLSADDAYGQHDEELIMEVDRDELPAELDVQVGQELEVTQDSGETFPVTVSEIGENTVTLDANHPLAGEELEFDIELVEIR